MRDALLHAGMHKTGSSAIQAALRGLDKDGVKALDWRGSNHSGLVAMLFHEPVEEFHAFRQNGLSRDQLLADRSEWADRTRMQLRDEAIRLPILSAELLSATGPEPLQRLRDFWMGCGRRPRVLAYVRPPVSYMSSSFQQVLKVPHNRRAGFESFWPRYRFRFEALDTVFGRENVELRPYSRATLRDGDVVSDFCRAIGIPPSPARSNETMSLEAVALLYAYKHLGPGLESGQRESTKRNHLLVQALQSIKGRRFSLGSVITDPVCDANRADLDWMNKRMGIDLLALEERPRDGIASLDELKSIAQDSMALVLKVLLEDRRAKRQSGDLTPVLHALSALHSLGHPKGPARN